MIKLNAIYAQEALISSMCIVFAESEVISLIHQNFPKRIYSAIARKVLSLV